MSNKRVKKTVQNYTLEEARYINTDGSELWLAIHKVTKCQYMLKKLGIEGSQAKQYRLKQSLVSREEYIHDHLLRQINILKSISGEHSPKCHKIIKTTNNYYLVYDPYPQTLLQAKLERQRPRNCEKIKLLIGIAQQISTLHQKGIVLVNLNINSIHIFNQDKIFIRDWGSARKVEDGDIAQVELLDKRKDFMAPEIEKGRCSFASDVYSLGKLINKIISRDQDESSQQRIKLEELVAKMMQYNPKLRPDISSVIDSLEKMAFENAETSLGHTPLHSAGFKQRQFSISTKQLSEISTGSTQEGDMLPIVELKSLFTQKDFSKKNSNTTFTQIKSLKALELSKNNSRTYNLNKTLSTTRFHSILQTSLAKQNSSRTVVSKGGNIQFLKEVCRKRSLAFFILSLAEFVVQADLVVELAYILTKYARLSIMSIIKEVEAKMKLEDIGDVRQLMFILKKEQIHITSSERIIKNNLVYKNCETGVKREMIDENTISDRLLRSKIVEFARRMVEFCDEEIIGGEAAGIEENMRQTYLLLKKVELGSYERFWSDAAQHGQSFLSTKATLKDRHITPRETLERINKILKEY